MKFVYLVLKNLLRNKRRLFLTILSIAVSLFVFSALVSLPTVANQLLASTASSERIICHNKAGLTYQLPEAYKQKIAVAPHIAAVVSQSWFGGIYHEPTDQFPNFAIDHEQIEAMWPEWSSTGRRGQVQEPAHCMPGRTGHHEALRVARRATGDAEGNYLSVQSHLHDRRRVDQQSAS